MNDNKENINKIELKSNTILSNYIHELNEDVKLSVSNLREKSLMCSSIWAKWISYLFLEKDNLQRIANAKQKILKSKASQMKVHDSLLKMKSEDKILENDENIKKLNELQRSTQDCIDFIERSLNMLSSFGFSIKNALEALKLEMTH
jgi:hypothetical protein